MYKLYIYTHSKKDLVEVTKKIICHDYQKSVGTYSFFHITKLFFVSFYYCPGKIFSLAKRNYSVGSTKFDFIY